ncbi:hypothetical protein BSKO_03821 [Bryopsis sp. KO-2023]|nr:hypothetical protein BSKO_03821 [Bryopsis sp. KO-2023]
MGQPRYVCFLLIGVAVLPLFCLVYFGNPWSSCGGESVRGTNLFVNSLGSRLGYRGESWAGSNATKVTGDAGEESSPEDNVGSGPDGNPYPFYPWWPSFCEMVLDSEAAKGTKSGEQRHGDKVPKMAITKMLYSLVHFMGLHETPDSPYDVTERPVPLEFDCESEKYKPFLTGWTREKPVKVAWGFQFAGEVPVLDIGLHELDGVVDHYIIYESTATHRNVRKPLFFESHKLRYERFLDRIVHLVSDDAHVPVSSFLEPPRQGSISGLDSKDHTRLTSKVKELTDILSDDDFFVMGDLDEIPDYRFLYHLKNCEVDESYFPSYSNTIFYINDFRHLFKGDHPPSQSFKYSHKHPTIHTFKQTKDITVARNFSMKVKAVPPLGGYHISNPPFLPSLVSKFYGSTGYGGGPITSNMTEWFEMYRRGEPIIKYGWKGRVVDPQGAKVPEIYREAFHLPWLVEHNKDKFPFFFLGEPSKVFEG